MRISTSYISQQNIDAMMKQQTDLAATQAQLATGKKIGSPSDDPVAAIKTLDIQRRLGLSNQYQDNASTAESKLSISEGILAQSVDVVQRIRELAVQGLNDTNSAEARAGIAEEIDQLNQALLGLANSTDANGEFLFSGYQTDQKPFTSLVSGYVPASPGAGDGQRSVRIGDGYTVEINEPGNKVFVSAHDINGTQSVFETINDFVADLKANTVGPASANGAFLSNIDNSLNTLLDTRTRVGARMNAV
ncbi:MAG: flagellar hook-associated protein FlgL, partial [Gammaproteobacteria bacterium]|nr:flagellar hook-associated protein FlgL [Gammaproteobacteria bacterium]